MNTPPRDRSKLYWSLQFAAWGAYFGLAAAQTLIGTRQVAVVLLWLVIMMFHVAASHLLRYVIRRWHWLDSRPVVLLAKCFAACLVLAVVVQVLNAPIPPLFGLVTLSEQLKLLRFFTFFSFILFAVWTGIYIGFQNYFRYREESELQKLRLETSLRDAELRALKAQINPHFLFNCLNNLRALIAEDSERAREMLLRLSELLRYSLDAGRRNKVTMAEELRIVNGYLELEKLQFDHRLTWRADIPNDALNIEVPPMLVQQLVENAIKHGIAPNKDGGEIVLWARATGQELELRVENTGRLVDSPRKGVGIESVQERLRLLCGSTASFELRSSGEGRVAATARIPRAA